MKTKRILNFILLTFLLVLLCGFTAQAKVKEVGPGIAEPHPEQDLFTMVNQKRGARSLNPLIWDEELAKVAAVRASEIAVSYGHTRPNGTAPQTAYKEANLYFSRAGENLAEDFEEAEDVYNKWYGSGASRENLLRKEFTHAAVAYYDRQNEDGTVTRFWVMEFMKPKAAPADAEEAQSPAEGTVTENAPTQAPAGNDIPDTDVIPAP